MKNEMLIKTDDPLLVKINQIKDIEEIIFSDLLPSTKDDRLNIIPSLLVRYDGGKILSLSSQDLYFDLFVKKVFQVYNLEKDRIIHDQILDPFGQRSSLKIDERTKRILEAGDLSNINQVYAFYDGKKSYSKSLLFQSDELILLLPMIKYHLKQIFNCTGRIISLDNDFINGYRNYYTLSYKIDGLDDILSMHFKSNYPEYHLYLRSLDKHFTPLEMTIRFNQTNIEVISSFQDYDLLSNSNYQIQNDNTITSTFKVSKKNIPIIYQENNLNQVNNPCPNLTNLDSPDDVIWYQLPWNALYGVLNKVDKINDIEHLVNVHNKYLAFSNEMFMLKEYASKEYLRTKTFDANKMHFVMDEVNKKIQGILLSREDGLYVIETYFQDVLGDNGYYDTYLNEKYFYHLAQNRDLLHGLNRNDLSSVSPEDNILCGADLLVTEDVKKLIRR